MNAAWIKYLPGFIREKLESRHGLQAILANTGWLFADKIIRMGVGLFVAVWIARYLGPEQFGLWNFAIAFAALFGAFATLGLDGIVVRELVKNPERQNELLGSAFALKLIGGAVTLLIAIFAISLVRSGEALTLWLVGLSAAGFIFQSVNVIDFYFQAKVQSRYTVYAANGAFVLMTLVKIALLLTSAPLIAFAWAGLGEIALTAIFLLVAYRVNHHNMREWRYDRRVAHELLKDSWPLIFSGLAIMIQARIDQVMLGNMIGNEEVGQYSAAMRLIEAFGVVPMIIMQSLAPAVTQARMHSDALYYERLTNIYRLMFLTFLLIAIPIFLLGDKIVLVLYGHEYEQAGALFSLFAIRQIFVNFGVGKSLFIVNENLFKYALMTAVIGAILNIGINYMLIPEYKSMGALWGTIISFSITIFAMDIFFDKTKKNLKCMLLGIVTFYKIKT